MLNRQGQPAQVDTPRASAAGTFSGNRGLSIEEALIFEIGRMETTGVDLEEPAKFSAKLGRLARTAPLGLPGLSEPE
ncbi:MAG TPA: aminomethyl-transferring glycine dehydrogenase subunit GcvPB, partial [Hyphomicrobiaceae bacterium]|nr:aminomethyl-transferring glycine dehydrogenase subunit GcvPB [Hyphomicrobiaceae bacterium]